MPKPCSVCISPDRAEIERSVMNRVSIREKARQFGQRVDLSGPTRAFRSELPSNATCRAGLIAQASTSEVTPSAPDWPRRRPPRGGGGG